MLRIIVQLSTILLIVIIYTFIFSMEEDSREATQNIKPANSLFTYMYAAIVC